MTQGKESTCNAGDAGSIPGLEGCPGGGHGNHSGILAWRITWTRGAWRATVHRVANSRTQLKGLSTAACVVNGMLHLSWWAFLKKSVCPAPSNKWKQEPAYRYYGNGLSMVRSMLVDWVYITCHTCSKLIPLWKSHTCKKPATCRQYDICSSESNFFILLPSLAKNTFWILGSCVGLTFQLKFTLLLILHLISVHGGWCHFM